MAIKFWTWLSVISLAGTAAIAIEPAISQIPNNNPAPVILPINAPVLYVAPGASGNGNASAPYGSITAALRSNPQPGTIIQLAPGKYSAETGEVFPLKLAPGLTLRGDDSSKGKDVIIEGGGVFISPTFARQNIALLASDETVIAGITLTNVNPRGYALWLESCRDVIVRNNRFIDTTHDGVFVTGDSAVTVSSNIFNKNRANGISVVGSSKGEISDNLFEDTGFGLAIGQQSTVNVINNRILNNRTGVVITNLSKPVLRGNLIKGSREDGVVVIKDRKGQPAPDLGTIADAGRNTFEANQGKDINNSSGVPLVAVGNQLNRQKIAGDVDLNLPPEPPAKAVPQPAVKPAAKPATKPPVKPASKPKTK